jgi:superoxide reductase
MTTRRQFLAAGAAIAGASALAPIPQAQAGGMPAGGLIYTKENPGRWAKKAASHAPEVSLDGGQVTVTTNHGMSAGHFIVRHTLVNEAGEVLGEKTFTAADEPTSQYPMPTAAGRYFATSFCNLHDLWVTEFTV